MNKEQVGKIYKFCEQRYRCVNPLEMAIANDEIWIEGKEISPVEAFITLHEIECKIYQMGDYRILVKGSFHK